MLKRFSIRNIALFGVPLLLAIAVSSGHLATPDSHIKLSQARQFVEQGTFNVPDGVGNSKHGNIFPGKNNNIYSVYNPGQTALYIPIYALARSLSFISTIHPHYIAEFIASFIGPTIHFSTAVILFLLLQQIGTRKRKAFIISGLFAFGTFSLPHSTDGYGHPFETIFILLSFLFIINASHEADSSKSKIYLIIAGSFIGIGLLFRITTLLAIPGILILLASRRTSAYLLLGIIPGIIFVAWYNWIKTGSPFDTGYLLAWQIANPNLAIQTGFNIYDIPANATSLWISPGKGMLLFSPLLLLSLIAWPSFMRKNPRLSASIATVSLTYTFFYAANFAWHGSPWCWGPRYLVPIVPLLIIVLCELNIRSNKKRLLVFSILIISILTQMLAISVDYRRYLITIYENTPSAFESNDILYEPRLSPLLGQTRAFQEVLAKIESKNPLYLYISPGPWTSEERPASNKMMLDSSLDYNSLNFWWVRLANIASNQTVKFFWIMIGVIAIISNIFIFRRIWLHIRLADG